MDHDRVWKKEGLRSCGHIELDAFIIRRESCKVPIIEPKLAAFARVLLLWVSDRNETHITRQGTDRICKCEKQNAPSDRRHSSNQLGMKRFKASSRHGKKKKAQWQGCMLPNVSTHARGHEGTVFIHPGMRGPSATLQRYIPV